MGRGKEGVLSKYQNLLYISGKSAKGIRQLELSFGGGKVEAEQMRGEHPAVAGDNAVLLVDQHRVGEAKFADRGGDLRDLLVAVRARGFWRRGSAPRTGAEQSSRVM